MLHFGGVDTQPLMWVQVFCKLHENGFILQRYRVDGDDPVDLPEAVNATDTVQYIMDKSEMSMDDEI